MDHILREILDMDKKAQLRMQKAEEYRKKALSELDSRKERIIEEETDRARKRAAESNERKKRSSEIRLKEIKERNERILNQMDKAYTDNFDKWVDGIVSAVTEE